MTFVPHSSQEVRANTLRITRAAAIVEERYSFYSLCTSVSPTPTMMMMTTMILGLRVRVILLLSPNPQPLVTPSSPANSLLLGIYHHGPFCMYNIYTDSYSRHTRYYNNICVYHAVIYFRQKILAVSELYIITMGTYVNYRPRSLLCTEHRRGVAVRTSFAVIIL